MKKLFAFAMILSLGMFCAVGCNKPKDKPVTPPPAAGAPVNDDAAKPATPDAAKPAIDDSATPPTDPKPTEPAPE